mgnify:CR=1 FL=1|jgi:hypothetical protein
MKTIDINYVKFELKKSINYTPYYNIKTLSDCYNKPSYKKQQCYDYWLNFYYTLNSDNKIVHPSIKSYNTFMFTIEMLIKINNTKYYLYITPSHNYAYPIIESEVK